MKPKILIIRGKFANEFELQNYTPLTKSLHLKLATSLHPLTPTSIPSIRLPSPADLPNFPYKQAILNRLIGGQHWLLGLKRLINQFRPDIVHVAETYYAYTYQAIRLKKQGLFKTLISTCWETIPHNNETLKLKRQWKQLAYQYIDHFITPTLKAKQALITEGVPANKISLIRVGVDLNRFTPSQAPNHQEQLCLTFIGRQVPEKGIDDLKQAVSLLPNIKLNLISSVPYSQIHQIYQNTDIFILPSRQTKTWEEQYGMVLVEAMASGLPIVTTNTGAIPEVVGQAAILVPPQSPQKLAQAIRQLINRPDLRQKLSTKARQRARRYFNRRTIAKQLQSLYNRFI